MQRIKVLFTLITLLAVTFISSLAQEKPVKTIVFTTLRPANHDIYLVDDRDSRPQRMTDNMGLDYNPVFSSSGCLPSEALA